MIPHAIPNLCGKEAEYLQQCIDTGFVSSVGPFVNRFERMVATAAGTLDAVATSSGTAGLHAALTAVGVGPGDLVIVPAMTFVATANAVSYCGATPWLFDVEPENWTLSAPQLAHVLAREAVRDGDILCHRKHGGRIAAVTPVFTLGLPPNMTPILETAVDYGLPVVADTAAALGATPGGEPIGQSGATLYVFSFNGNKTVTAGGGGAVCGNDKDLVELVRHLTTTARVGDDYEHDRVGFNYRMTNLQAAVGCAQMEALDHLVRRKREIHAFYKAAFALKPGINTFADALWGEGACWLSGIILEGPLAGAAETIRERLRTCGIDCKPFWKPMHLLAPYRDAPATSMPVSEHIWRRVITLPSSTNLTNGDLQYVADAILQIVEGLQS